MSKMSELDIEISRERKENQMAVEKRSTEDAGDYGGSCDTCAQGQVTLGHRQCPACERAAADKAALDQLHDEIADLVLRIDS